MPSIGPMDELRERLLPTQKQRAHNNVSRMNRRAQQQQDHPYRSRNTLLFDSLHQNNNNSLYEYGPVDVDDYLPSPLTRPQQQRRSLTPSSHKRSSTNAFRTMMMTATTATKKGPILTTARSHSAPKFVRSNSGLTEYTTPTPPRARDVSYRSKQQQQQALHLTTPTDSSNSGKPLVLRRASSTNSRKSTSQLQATTTTPSSSSAVRPRSMEEDILAATTLPLPTTTGTRTSSRRREKNIVDTTTTSHHREYAAQYYAAKLKPPSITSNEQVVFHNSAEATLGTDTHNKPTATVNDASFLDLSEKRVRHRNHIQELPSPEQVSRHVHEQRRRRRDKQQRQKSANENDEIHRLLRQMVLNQDSPHQKRKKKKKQEQLPSPNSVALHPETAQQRRSAFFEHTRPIDLDNDDDGSLSTRQSKPFDEVACDHHDVEESPDSEYHSHHNESHSDRHEPRNTQDHNNNDASPLYSRARRQVQGPPRSKRESYSNRSVENASRSLRRNSVEDDLLNEDSNSLSSRHHAEDLLYNDTGDNNSLSSRSRRHHGEATSRNDKSRGPRSKESDRSRQHKEDDAHNDDNNSLSSRSRRHPGEATSRNDKSRAPVNRSMQSDRSRRQEDNFNNDDNNSLSSRSRYNAKHDPSEDSLYGDNGDNNSLSSSRSWRRMEHNSAEETLHKVKSQEGNQSTGQQQDDTAATTTTIRELQAELAQVRTELATTHAAWQKALWEKSQAVELASSQTFRERIRAEEQLRQEMVKTKQAQQEIQELRKQVKELQKQQANITMSTTQSQTNTMPSFEDDDQEASQQSSRLESSAYNDDDENSFQHSLDSIDQSRQVLQNDQDESFPQYHETRAEADTSANASFELPAPATQRPGRGDSDLASTCTTDVITNTSFYSASSAKNISSTTIVDVDDVEALDVASEIASLKAALAQARTTRNERLVSYSHSETPQKKKKQPTARIDAARAVLGVEDVEKEKEGTESLRQQLRTLQAQKRRSQQIDAGEATSEGQTPKPTGKHRREGKEHPPLPPQPPSLERRRSKDSSLLQTSTRRPPIDSIPRDSKSLDDTVSSRWKKAAGEAEVKCLLEELQKMKDTVSSSQQSNNSRHRASNNFAFSNIGIPGRSSDGHVTAVDDTVDLLRRRLDR